MRTEEMDDEIFKEVEKAQEEAVISERRIKALGSLVRDYRRKYGKKVEIK